MNKMDFINTMDNKNSLLIFKKRKILSRLNDSIISPLLCILDELQTHFDISDYLYDFFNFI